MGGNIHRSGVRLLVVRARPVEDLLAQCNEHNVNEVEHPDRADEVDPCPVPVLRTQPRQGHGEEEPGVSLWTKGGLGVVTTYEVVMSWRLGRFVSLVQVLCLLGFWVIPKWVIIWPKGVGRGW